MEEEDRLITRATRYELWGETNRYYYTVTVSYTTQHGIIRFGILSRKKKLITFSSCFRIGGRAKIWGLLLCKITYVYNISSNSHVILNRKMFTFELSCDGATCVSWLIFFCTSTHTSFPLISQKLLNSLQFFFFF